MAYKKKGTLANPWLQIPAHDYEAHMASPEVGQLQVLNKLLGSVLVEFKPQSLAVLGCCTGNGFEHISPTITKRVLGIDINPAYLDVLRQRFSRSLPNLHLVEQDIASPSFHMKPVSMIFAALVFEYVNIDHALQNIAKCLLPGGMLVAALQLPSQEAAAITPTQYTSLAALASIMNLVDTEHFSAVCSQNGFAQVKSEEIPLKHGKAFFVGYFANEATIIPE